MKILSLNLLQEGSSVPLAPLAHLVNPNPTSKTWTSQRFPIYPVFITLYANEPPFNCVSIVFERGRLPKSVVVQASADGTNFKVLQKLQLSENHPVSSFHFREPVLGHYVRFCMQSSHASDVNICEQLSIRGFLVSLVSHPQSKYYKIEFSFQIHPILLSVLRGLEAQLLGPSGKSYSEHSLFYERVFKELQMQIGKQAFSVASPPEGILSKYRGVLESLEKQRNSNKTVPLPVRQINGRAKLEAVSMKANLKKQLDSKPISRELYQHFVIDLRNAKLTPFILLLANGGEEMLHQALFSAWSELEDDAMGYSFLARLICYLLIKASSKIKLAALHVCALFLRKRPQLPDEEWQQLLSELFGCLETEQVKQATKCLYIALDCVPQDQLLSTLLAIRETTGLETRLRRIYILQKYTYRSIRIDNPLPVCSFIEETLLVQQLSLADKNAAYNVIAYLCSLFGREYILDHLHRLNAIILLNLERCINQKLSLLGKNPNQQANDQKKCEYCSQMDEGFQDPDRYDLHCFKQCIGLTMCDQCAQIIDITKLSQHWLDECPHRRNFYQCGDCRLTLPQDQKQLHLELCARRSIIECPLCHIQMGTKIKLKEHIVNRDCSENPRNVLTEPA